MPPGPYKLNISWPKVETQQDIQVPSKSTLNLSVIYVACDGCTGNPDGTPCDDANTCTSNDKCINNVCVGTPIPNCTVTCPAGYADCNQNSADGCETNVSTSLTNCEAGGWCALFGPNASAACTGGTCTIASCTNGFGLTATETLQTAVRQMCQLASRIVELVVGTSFGAERFRHVHSGSLRDSTYYELC